MTANRQTFGVNNWKEMAVKAGTSYIYAELQVYTYLHHASPMCSLQKMFLMTTQSLIPGYKSSPRSGIPRFIIGAKIPHEVLHT